MEGLDINSFSASPDLSYSRWGRVGLTRKVSNIIPCRLF